MCVLIVEHIDELICDLIILKIKCDHLLVELYLVKKICPLIRWL